MTIFIGFSPFYFVFFRVRFLDWNKKSAIKQWLYSPMFDG